jgi:spore maturation protein CgeB
MVAGPQYPESLVWPCNVRRIEHLPPDDHRQFYNSQRFTLNITRAPMVTAGYSPSVRLFEAAGCGVPVITDPWAGLDAFFTPDEEIFVCHSADEALQRLMHLPDATRCEIGERARQRVLSAHTASHRAAALETIFHQIADAGLKSSALACPS